MNKPTMTDPIFDFHVLSVHLKTQSEPLHAWFQSRFFRNALPPTTGDKKQCDLIITTGQPLDLETDVASKFFTNMFLAGAPVEIQNAVLTCRHAEFEMRFDLHRSHLHLNISADLFADGSALWERVLNSLFIHYLLPFHQVDMVHCAALTHPSGRTILLAGPSQAGKTTLALKLMENGYRLISDDRPLITRQQDQVLVHSSYSLKPVSITSDTLDLFPHYESYVMEVLPNQKLALDTVKLWQEDKLSHGPAVVTDFIVLHRSLYPLEPRFKPLNKMTALEAMMAESMMIFYTNDAVPEPLRQYCEFRFSILHALLAETETINLYYSPESMEPVIERLAGEAP